MAEEYDLENLDKYKDNAKALLAIAYDLKEAYDAAENEVQSLSQQLESRRAKRGGGGGGGGDRDQIAQLERDLADREDQLATAKSDAENLRDENSDLKTQIKTLTEDVRQAKLLEKSQNEELDKRKKEISELVSSQLKEKSKATSFSKQRSDAMEESRRQHAENTVLQEEVRE